jgi:phosphatidylglycerophosphate synthase
MAEVQATYKPRDAWWTVLLVDPLAGRLVRLVSPYRWVTPNWLTVAAFALGLGSAACFLQGVRGWLITGALIYHLSFVVDCMDGKIARLRQTGSIFGSWLDFIGDRVRVMLCAMALMGGQYLVTGRAVYLVLATVIVALALFRYLNSAKIEEIEASMASNIEVAYAATGQTPPMATAVPPGAAEHAGMEELQSRLGILGRLRVFLNRHRIRAHLVSGVEFEMAVFVIAPITGALIAVPVAAGGLLLLFEGAFVYRLWLAARSTSRTLDGLSAVHR